MSPEEEKAAQEALDAAVETYLHTMGWNGTEADGGLVLTSWVLVGHQAGWTMDDATSGYIMCYKGGQQPDHVARGLLGQGLDMVRCVGRYEREPRRDDDGTD